MYVYMYESINTSDPKTNSNVPDQLFGDKIQ